MEAYQKSYSPNEIIYDDEFKVSIFNIFDRLAPRNEKDLQLALDINGYYGRSKIYPLVYGGRKNDEYKIEIYLPNSKVKYNWPMFTTFRFNRIYELYKFYKKIPRCIVDTFIIGSKISCVTPYYIIQHGIKGVGKDITHSVDLLHQSGLFYNNSCIIKDPTDIKEVASNLVFFKPY